MVSTCYQLHQEAIGPSSCFLPTIVICRWRAEQQCGFSGAFPSNLFRPQLFKTPSTAPCTLTSPETWLIDISKSLITTLLNCVVLTFCVAEAAAPFVLTRIKT